MKVQIFIAPIFGLLLLGSYANAQTEWPTNGWTVTTPSEVGLDARTLAEIDADIGEGKYGYVDSMLVIRHGKLAYERYYGHDYGEIYKKEAATRGPLVVGDLTGPYNYFNDWWHPYYRDTNLHTMQSATKSVVSAVVGIAVGRGEFPDIDTPVLNFFESGTVANVDERKERMTIRHLLTMSTGLDWNEDVPYIDPKNTWSDLQGAPDWAQFTIDRPMEKEPGKEFKYNSGATLILGHIFYRATGTDLEEYAAEHLFEPLGIDEYFWKRTPLGRTDVQEGLYVSSRDIAKIAYLFLQRGQWAGKQIVPDVWVRDSIHPSLPVTADASWEYGYKWWLIHYQHGGEDLVAFEGNGFGGQLPIVLPDLDMVIVFTGWNALPDRPSMGTDVAIRRVVEAVTNSISQ